MRTRDIGFSSLALAGLALGLSSACSSQDPAPSTEGAPLEGNGGAPSVDPAITPAGNVGGAGTGNSEDPNNGITDIVDGQNMAGAPGDTVAVPPVVPPPPCEGDPTACPLPAFPGADGAGGYVTGGRGGDVYHVTRLDTDFNDMTPGTLRFGLSMTGPRTIVFDISGVFSLSRAAVAGWSDNGNGWDTASRLNIPNDVTIAGQTAPGPVIIRGGVIKAGGANFILRNVTIAPGYGNRGFDEPDQPPVADTFPDTSVFDAIDISGTNLIIDHVSTVYATDETVSMNEEVNNVTVQYSIISQGQNYPQADAEDDGVRYTGHALGSLVQGGSNAKVSIHHNLYAHQKGRLPRVGTEADALTVAGVGAFNDLRNNVFYNWYDAAGAGASGQPSQNNFVANFYLAGPGGDDPSGGASTALVTKAGGTRIFDGNDLINTKLYHSGNVKDVTLDADAQDGVPLTAADFVESSLQALPFTVPYAGVTDTAEVAFTRVLDYAGSRHWERSAIDQRLVAETRAGTGKIVAWADDPFNPSPDEGVEWRNLVATASVARPAGFDTDQDGMPDAWETEHALNLAVADNNGDFDTDGYTNLEEYINEIAAWPAATPALFLGGKSRRYAQIQNWGLSVPSTGTEPFHGSAPWQPGARDVAQILTGTAVVDAVGQHAGTLEVSAARGMAVLEVDSGWLEIGSSVFVGSSSSEPLASEPQRRAGAGQIIQRGGRLRSQRGVVLGGVPGATAEYALLGGVLSTPRLLKSPGSALSFVGGTLHADEVAFDLHAQGGVLWPGRLTESERHLDTREPRFGYLRIQGDLELGSGQLRIALGDAQSDAVAVSGDVALGGTLDLVELDACRPARGESWTLLTAQGQISGQFASVPSGFRVDVRGQRVILTHGEPREEPATAEGLARAATH